jgi:hypothetical protein
LCSKAKKKKIEKYENQRERECALEKEERIAEKKMEKKKRTEEKDL